MSRRDPSLIVEVDGVVQLHRAAGEVAGDDDVRLRAVARRLGAQQGVRDVRHVAAPGAQLVVPLVGAHHDIDVTYGELGAHLVEHALLVDGPVQETYLVGPRDTADPTRWRTEIGRQVFRTG